MRSLEQIVADNKLYGFVRSTDNKVLCVGCARRRGEAGDPHRGNGGPQPTWSPLTGMARRNFDVNLETMHCDRCQGALKGEEEK
jgi:hypothetical protein